MAAPRIFGRVYEAQASGVWQSLVYGQEKLALSLAYTTSQRASSAMPNPTAGPLTATTTGLGKVINVLTKSLQIHDTTPYDDDRTEIWILEPCVIIQEGYCNYQEAPGSELSLAILRG